MHSLNRKEKVICENCGTKTTLNLAHHKKRCSAGSHACSSCASFSAKSRAGVKYHISKKHSIANARIVHRFKVYDKHFHSFFNWREHKRKENEAQRNSGTQNVIVAHVMGDVDYNSLKEEMETCKHFLVDSEMERWMFETLPWILWTSNTC